MTRGTVQNAVPYSASPHTPRRSGMDPGVYASALRAFVIRKDKPLAFRSRREPFLAARLRHRMTKEGWEAAQRWRRRMFSRQGLV